jgi:YgiT-type zinc finger domain-containing protein
MRCIHCQGKMEWRSAPFQIDRRGYHLTLEAIPAWVCVQCGEAYFEEREVRHIQEFIREADEAAGQLAAAG